MEVPIISDLLPPNTMKSLPVNCTQQKNQYMQNIAEGINEKRSNQIII